MDVIGQPADDPDWWEARKQDGSHGLVPRSYIEIVHSTNGRGNNTSMLSMYDYIIMDCDVCI